MLFLNGDLKIVFKIVILGNSGVGKTNILNCLNGKEYKKDEKLKSTIGIDFVKKETEINKEIITAQLWDTCGEERYRSLMGAYLKNTNGAFIVYDITNEESFNSVDTWIYILKNNSEHIIIILGNKCDSSDRKINEEKGFEKAKQYNAFFFETSCINKHNLDKAFNYMTGELYKRYKENLNKEEEEEIEFSNICLENNKIKSKEDICC